MAGADSVIVCSLPFGKNALHSLSSIECRAFKRERAHNDCICPRHILACTQLLIIVCWHALSNAHNIIREEHHTAKTHKATWHHPFMFVLLINANRDGVIKLSVC